MSFILKQSLLLDYRMDWRKPIKLYNVRLECKKLESSRFMGTNGTQNSFKNEKRIEKER